MKNLNDRGYALVWCTLMVVLLLIIVGMGLDIGQLSFSRATGQTAVDAAALSAATGLPISDGAVKARAKMYRDWNNYTDSGDRRIDDANVEYASYNENTGELKIVGDISTANAVRVSLEKKNPYSEATSNTGMRNPAFLTPLLNLFGATAEKSHEVSVSSVAVLKAVPGIPIAVMTKTCAETGSFDLLSQNTHEDNMCWTAYLDNTSTDSVKNLFRASRECDGGLPEGDLVTIGTDINLNNGVGGAYDEAKNTLIGENGANVGKCWFVPVIRDVTDGGCNQWEAIKDWAKICPTAIEKHGKFSKITTTIQCNQSLFQRNANQCFSYRLVREPAAGM